MSFLIGASLARTVATLGSNAVARQVGLSMVRGPFPSLIVSSSPEWTLLTSMSTIELVDPELRDALALWPLQPLTADTHRR
jgi:hypothetical protein